MNGSPRSQSLLRRRSASPQSGRREPPSSAFLSGRLRDSPRATASPFWARATAPSMATERCFSFSRGGARKLRHGRPARRSWVPSAVPVTSCRPALVRAELVKFRYAAPATTRDGPGPGAQAVRMAVRFRRASIAWAATTSSRAASPNSRPACESPTSPAGRHDDRDGRFRRRPAARTMAARGDQGRRRA